MYNLTEVGSLSWSPSGEETSAANIREGHFKKDLEAIIPSLRGYARSLCGSADRGDDIVQDTLLRAWSSRESYQDGSNFKAWVFTILRNAFLSSVRRKKFEGEYHEGSEERLYVPANQLDSLSVGELQEALLKLPPEQRETLMLVVVGGFSYIEAAQISGCMVGTVKSRVGRARAALQRMLDGDVARSALETGHRPAANAGKSKSAGPKFRAMERQRDTLA
jgi:RNA polymerase sigma factor (sigma-70 family)